MTTYSDICLPSFCARMESARLRYSVAPLCRRNLGWRSLNELLRLTSSGLVADVEFVGDVESDSASLPLALSTMLAARERTSRGDSGKTGDLGLDISITCEIEIRSSHKYGFGC